MIWVFLIKKSLLHVCIQRWARVTEMSLVSQILSARSVFPDYYTVCNIYVRIPSIAFPQSCNSNFGSCSCFPPSPEFHVASQGGQRAWSYWLKSCCLNDMKFPFFAKFSLLHFSCWFVLLSLQAQHSSHGPCLPISVNLEDV